MIKKIKIKQATKKGYVEMVNGGVFDATYINSKTRRGRVQMGGYAVPTITATPSDVYRMEADMVNADDYRIRKLTPEECWRLMDFNKGSFQAAEKVNSNSQLYKQAGNSIVVNVLVAIMGQMFEGHENDFKKI